MFKILLAAAVFLAPSAFADEVTYDECRKIVSMTDFLLSAQSECDVSLDLEAAELYKQCYSTLSQAHVDIARTYAAKQARDTKAKVGGEFCSFVKKTFAAIITP